MKTIIYPDKKNWASFIQRPAIAPLKLTKLVEQLFEQVQKNGDKAILQYTKQYDGVELDSLRISENTMQKAYEKVPAELRKAIKLAKKNIEKFHRQQKEKTVRCETTPGVQCWRESRAIDRVGIYIPGGTAPLFSTVLMLGIPAQIAGCKEIVLCSPPDKNGELAPAILYTAHLLGIRKVYRVGGIQAIAAMTFGTKSVPKVDKIFGPGNQFVSAAKQLSQKYGLAIDLPAGPSEVLIITDQDSSPDFVAADLLSQAEHGKDSQVMLLSDNKKMIKKIQAELAKQIVNLPRKEMATSAIKNSYALVLPTISDCLEFSNLYAPEHLILAQKDPGKIVPKIQNAGSVFIGRYSCESAGDYASGTNHTLPTNGNARSYSGVSLDSFVKKITFQKVSKKGLQKMGPAIEIMASAEQLTAHKNAVSIRLKKS